MLSFPNAKINLGLNIVSKRPDGYHNIESCFYPVPWNDVLEIIPSNTFKFTASGLDIPGDPETNLCFRAYNLLKEKYRIPPVQIHLHKVIPMGAGLGGGSSDGAFALKMLNELFELNLEIPQLEKLAGKLGSDCPFFIQNKPVFVTGTGSNFQPIDLTLSGKYLALKHPEIHVSTREAYSKVIPQIPQISIPEILKSPVKEWANLLQNDFEASVFPHHSEIKQLKKELYQKSALYASMSGSGSAVYGIYEKPPDLQGWEVLEL